MLKLALVTFLLLAHPSAVRRFPWRKRPWLGMFLGVQGEWPRVDAQMSYENLPDVFCVPTILRLSIGIGLMWAMSTAPRFSSIRFGGKPRRTPVPATCFYRAEKYHRRHFARQGDAVFQG